MCKSYIFFILLLMDKIAKDKKYNNRQRERKNGDIARSMQIEL